MFYAIYNDGQWQERDSIESIFTLPGKYEVYSVIDKRIEYRIDISNSKPVIISDFEITLFDRHLIRSEIQVYDHSSGKYFDLVTRGGNVATLIRSLTEDLKFARTFPSFETYLKHEGLKEENVRLKKENQKLKDKIRKNCFRKK